MSSFFRQLGRTLGPGIRRGQWLWQAATGTEQERVEAERVVGRELAAAIRTGMGVDSGSAAATRVEELGERLVKATRDRYRRFSFEMVTQEQPNAFALPGGFVFVTRALLDLVCAPDELAFILGHEIVHVTEEHALDRLVANMALNAAVRRFPAGVWVKSTGAQLLQSAYSRDTELLTDRLGARLARAAGFDPQAAGRMLERLHESAGERAEGVGTYFSTHPSFVERIAELRRYLGPDR